MLSLIASEKRISYGNEIAARAASPKWRAKGEQCIVVREAPGLKPRGEPPFLDPWKQKRAWELWVDYPTLKGNLGLADQH